MVLVCALTGCTIAPGAPEAIATPTSTPTSTSDPALAAEWKAEYVAFVAEYGAEATGTELSEADAHAAAAAAAEKVWTSVTDMYPDAVRPAAQFVAWTETGSIDRQAPLIQCIEAAGISIDEPVAADGSATGIGWSATNEDERVADYACGVSYPHRPVNLPAFLTWVWAYNTYFLRPCLEAHGLPQEPLPDFDVYITGEIGWSVDWGEEWEADLAAQPDPAIAADCRYRQ